MHHYIKFLLGMLIVAFSILVLVKLLVHTSFEDMHCIGYKHKGIMDTKGADDKVWAWRAFYTCFGIYLK